LARKSSARPRSGNTKVSEVRLQASHDHRQAATSRMPRLRAADLAQGRHCLRQELRAVDCFGFQAIWHITQSKNSISTVELSRHSGLKWVCGWLMRQKLTTQPSRPASSRAASRWTTRFWAVSVDQGGKRGRGGRIRSVSSSPFLPAMNLSCFPGLQRPAAVTSASSATALAPRS
jgi:hypothetical protein